MLVLLFFKVPVFIAVLGGSMVYFVMNPGINTVIFAQQAIIGTEKISLMAIPFFVCAGIFRCSHELHGGYKENHGFL